MCEFGVDRKERLENGLAIPKDANTLESRFMRAIKGGKCGASFSLRQRMPFLLHKRVNYKSTESRPGRN
jgi:hypothetical protein